MKKIYTLFALFLALNFTASATINPGFIVTKDAKIITGLVADVFYSNWKTELIFVNEMGRSYHFPPNVIKGFAFNTGSEVLQFESKFLNGKWHFLKVLEKGKAMNLYCSPSVKTQEMLEHTGTRTLVNQKVKEFWLEKEEGQPFRIYLMGYKKQLKNYLWEEPTLVEKIGKKGYKFKDLQKIITEYNELVAQKSAKI